MTKKLFASALLFFILIGSVFAGITVAVDSTSTYKPTTIVNGKFSSKPWMTYVYNGTTYKSSSSGYTSSNVTPSSITKNGVDGGWNSTETSTYCGNLFEWSGNGSVFSHFYVSNSTLASNGRYYVDMNCNHASVLYQDLTTVPGDVVRWSLQHAPSIRGTAETVQDMHVEVGNPNGTPSGTNANLKSSGKAVYKATGITTGSGTVAFANSSELTNLSVSRSGKTGSSYSDTVAECNAFFKDVAGVYIVPSGQTTTRFAFVSDDTTYPTCGNLLSNLTFNTLIGNLKAVYNSNGTVTLTGYWGETDTSKKLIVKVGSLENKISMSSVTGKNFKITLSSDVIGDEVDVFVYHQDYEVAKKEIHIEGKYGPTKKSQFNTSCTFTNGINESLCTTSGNTTAAVFADTKTAVVGSTRKMGTDGKFIVVIPNGFKYYDGTLYDLYIKCISYNTSETATTWKQFNLVKVDSGLSDGNYVYELKTCRNQVENFGYEIWLQDAGKSTVVSDIDLVAGSCSFGTNEFFKVYTDDETIYTNIPTPASYLSYDSTNLDWKSSNSTITNKHGRYVLGHGKNSSNSIKGAYRTTSSSAANELVVGYMTKKVTFVGIRMDTKASVSPTLGYSTLNVATGKKVAVLPSAWLENFGHRGWYLGTNTTKLYTTAEMKEVLITADTTIKAVFYPHYHSWYYYTTDETPLMSSLRAYCTEELDSDGCLYYGDNKKIAVISLKIPNEVTLTATMTGEEGSDKTFSWRSSDPAVATVSEEGRIMAMKKGSTTVTAIANDGSGVKQNVLVTVE